MTSSHFFRQSLFHFEEEPTPNPLTDKHVLTPWTSHEAPPTEASKRSPRSIDIIKPIPPIPEKQPEIPKEKPKEIVKEIPKRISNLLPEKRPYLQNSDVLPAFPKAQPTTKKLQSELKLRGMPIKEFLSHKREQRELEEMLHRRSIELINESLEASFLARRSLRKRSSLGYSNTIDIQRDLLHPLQIYRSQQVVEITPEKFVRRRNQVSSLNKYLPIRSERYQL